MLDIGNIKEPIDKSYRKNLIYSMYAQNQYVKNPEIDQELKLTGEVYLNELLRLKEYLGKWGKQSESGTAIHHIPYVVFYSLCQILQKYKNEIHIVKLPEYMVRKTSIILTETGAKFRRRNLQNSSPMKVC